MVVGVLIGKFIPAIPNFLAKFEYSNVSIAMALVTYANKTSGSFSKFESTSQS
jgi:hypothetical protein